MGTRMGDQIAMTASRWLVTAVTLCAASCSPDENTSAMTASEIDSMVRREAPVGSNASQVVAFLDSHKIEHSGYREVDRTIFAIVRDTSRGPGTKGSIQVEFRFDDGAKLKDHALREVITGP